MHTRGVCVLHSHIHVHVCTYPCTHTHTHTHAHMQKIETDEKAKGPQSKEVSHDDLEVCCKDLEAIIGSEVHLRKPGKCLCFV